MSWDEYPEAADAPEAHRVPAEGTADEVAGGGLPDPARRAFVTLLTNRHIARSRHRHVWDALLTYEAEIRALLSEMFLDLVIDREVEVAFKRQQEGEDIPRGAGSIAYLAHVFGFLAGALVCLVMRAGSQAASNA